MPILEFQLADRTSTYADMRAAAEILAAVTGRVCPSLPPPPPPCFSFARVT